MPRITYADRIRTLLEKDYIPTRDRSYLESIYRHYRSKGSLTVGRRQHFLRLEEKYAKPPALGEEDEAMIEKLELYKIRAEKIDDKWMIGFFTSLIEQLKSGKTLSVRQSETFNNIIETQLTDKNMQQAKRWKENWNDEKRERFSICASYYARAGYYHNIVSKWRTDKEYVPSYGEYKKLTENKYAKGVLRGWYSDPKFQLGDTVSMSAKSNWGMKSLVGDVFLVVKINGSIPTTHAKGNKKYLIFHIKTGKYFQAEERQLKKAKKPKKKS